jgi:integrase
MRGSWWIFVQVTTTVTSMASLTRKPRSKYWFACFRDVNGRQRRKSTGHTDRKKALKVAEQFEQVGQRKLAPQTVRETLAELYREIYSETLPVATVRKFIADWLHTKQPEVSAGTLAFYKKSTAKFLEFLGTAADLDLASITRITVLEFRNHIAKRNSPVTTNSDLKAIKMICRAAKRDGYIAEDPAEFVETVRKNSEQARRPFTISEIQRVISAADAEWKSLILFGLYTGQRLADIATLTWDHVDLARNEIRLKTRKTAKRLTIPFAAPLRTHLDALAVGAERGSPIHPRAFGTMSRQGKSGNLSNQFSDILAKAGLRQKAPHRTTHKGRGARRTSYELSFHSLRHTAVSLLKDAGIPEATVMELVGHESKQMSAHYTHVGREALEKAAAAFPEL